MKYLKFIWLFFLLFSLTSRANHIVASELSYQYKGNNKYEFTLNLYRDCAGIPVTSSATLKVLTKNNDSSFLELKMVSGSGKELNLYCPSIVSTCNSGTSSYPGVQLYTYKGFIFLNAKTSDEYWFSWTDCCRNNAINTASAGEIGEKAYINLKDGAGNSSPEYLNYAVPAVCLGEKYCYSQGVIEANGDSLSFEQLDPVGVNYNSSFSKENPLSSSIPITFDSKTGEMCFKPSNIEVTVFAYKVNEFRNGKLIGSVTRNMQVIVVPCNNSIPTLTGIDGTNVFIKNACAGENICFDIPSVDADANQNLKLTWNGAIKDATFNPGNGSRPKGKFCWKTDASMVRNQPYVFTVTVTDDNCPRISSQTFTFSIYLKPSQGFSIGNDTARCEGESYTIKSKINSKNYISKVWSNQSNADSIIVNSTGTYTLTVTDSSKCVISKSVKVVFNPLPNIVVMGDTVVCVGEKLLLEASGASTYQWGPSSITASKSNKLVTLINNSQKVFVKGRSDFGCEDSVQQQILVLPKQSHQMSSDTSICKGSTVAVNVSNSTGDITWNSNAYLVDINDFQKLSTPQKSVQYAVTIKDQGFCDWKGKMNIEVTEDVTANFKTISDAVDISSNNTKFTDASLGNIAKWYWDFGDGDFSIDKNVTHNFKEVGKYDVKLIVFDQSGCSDTIVKRVKVDYYSLFIPNSFSPNNDGLNDIFLAYGTNLVHFEMFIFNRWGEQIFYSNKLNEGWDGTYSAGSEKVQEDTYVYLINYVLENNEKLTLTKRGIVTILK